MKLKPKWVSEVIAPAILLVGMVASGAAWYQTGGAFNAFSCGINLGMLVMMLIANYFMRLQDRNLNILLNLTEQIVCEEKDASNHPRYH